MAHGEARLRRMGKFRKFLQHPVAVAVHEGLDLGDEEEEADGRMIVLPLERLARVMRAREHAGGLNPAQREALRYLARFAADHSFNAITVDGECSTNDCVMMLANGATGVTVQRPPVHVASWSGAKRGI